MSKEQNNNTTGITGKEREEACVLRPSKQMSVSDHLPSLISPLPSVPRAALCFPNPFTPFPSITTDCL